MFFRLYCYLCNRIYEVNYHSIVYYQLNIFNQLIILCTTIKNSFLPCVQVC